MGADGFVSALSTVADVNVFEDEEQNAATIRTESSEAHSETANFAPSCEFFFFFIYFL
jgi:hypothetical protein